MGGRRQETGDRLNPSSLRHTPIVCLSNLHQQTSFLVHIANGGYSVIFPAGVARPLAWEANGQNLFEQ